ncbi:TOMM precursor leader peptide-binding protein [Streptomyces sp. HC44]|uniref:TOMM leader peptide-binding protein n=1 Tax=Streptomyces scabichelini TaxID=2711217 RepID=A0A6G4UZD2_9ACTN|nr:TOMM precursor leader peptide-binding protein [Streptomyces scabichelini]NGO07010.1 TOMM precursor leader peptide-binding protein [Streptomyces scabichelini]
MTDGCYRVKRHFSVVVHSPDRVEFRDGVWNARSALVDDKGASGRLAAVVAALDGTRTPAEAADVAQAPQAEVQAVLDHLKDLDVLEDAPDNYTDHYLDLISGRGPQPRETPPVVLVGSARLCASVGATVTAALPSAKVVEGGPDHPLAAPGPAEAAWLEDGLEFHRAMDRFADLTGSFVVLLDEVVDPLRAQLVNRVCGHHDIPWLYAAADGPFATVGPLVVPGRTACWECYETRVWMNLRESASYQRYKAALAQGAVAPPDCSLQPVLAQLLTAHTAPEVLSFATTGTAVTASQVLALYLPTMEFAVNEVLRVPGCPACAPAPERDDRELYFDLRALREPQEERA